MSQTLADDSEVVFDQPEESAGAMEPEGPLQNRHKKEAWLEDTEPYRGARPRTMEFDRPVDGGLGATLGGVEDEDKLRNGMVPVLRPEEKIQQEEEVQTPPRREPRRNEGTSGYDGGIGSGSGGPGGPAEGDSGSAPTKRRMVTRGGIGRYRVSYAARSRGVTDRKPISEDAQGTKARAPGATSSTYDYKCTLV